MNSDLSGVGEFVQGIGDIVSMLPKILIGVAVVYFFWGVIKFIAAGEDEAKRASGKKGIVWGIVGIVVMVSLWGIIAVIQNILGI